MSFVNCGLPCYIGGAITERDKLLVTPEQGLRERSKLDVRSRTLVGAGFIGLEMAENFVRRGVATTVVELQVQVLQPLDKEMSS